jgi:hypothetical protein
MDRDIVYRGVILEVAKCPSGAHELGAIKGEADNVTLFE